MTETLYYIALLVEILINVENRRRFRMYVRIIFESRLLILR